MPPDNFLNGDFHNLYEFHPLFTSSSGSLLDDADEHEPSSLEQWFRAVVERLEMYVKKKEKKVFILKNE